MANNVDSPKLSHVRNWPNPEVRRAAIDGCMRLDNGHSGTWGKESSRADPCDPQQFWDADEIVGGPTQDEEAVDPFHAAKLDLALPGYCLDPAKTLFDALADRVAFMAGGSGINQCAACFAQGRDRPVERDLPCDVALAKFGDKASCVEYLTGAPGYAVFGLLAFDQDDG